MTEPFRFQEDEEVTVVYPPTSRYPRGRRRDGVVAKRTWIERNEARLPRYTVLFTDDRADVLIPQHWIERRGQVVMAV